MIREACIIRTSVIGASMAQALCAIDNEAPSNKSMAQLPRHWLSLNGASLAHDGEIPRAMEPGENLFAGLGE